MRLNNHSMRAYLYKYEGLNDFLILYSSYTHYKTLKWIREFIALKNQFRDIYSTGKLSVDIEASVFYHLQTEKKT